jgi:hypothetical protein
MGDGDLEKYFYFFLNKKNLKKTIAIFLFLLEPDLKKAISRLKMAQNRFSIAHFIENK